MAFDYAEGKSFAWNVVGGHFEFKMFIDDTAEGVIKRYHKYINGAALHPFWSQGYH